jgi:hypothetical protein
MKLRHLIFFAGSIAALLPQAHGSGSFLVEDIKPLLKQKKEIYGLLTDSLDLATSGSADRIGQSVNPNLGGTRVAPYIVYAKPKGARDWVLEIQIDATTEYLDPSGKPTSMESATSVRETLLSIRISPLQK